MKEDFTGKLLDAGLRRYSSVEVPEGFAERLAAKKAEDPGREAGSRRWWWMLLPATAAVVAALVFWPRSTPRPPEQPPVALSPAPSLPPPGPSPLPAVRPVAARPAKPRWRTLSPSELAIADFPLQILSPWTEKPLKDLEIQPLEIKPLAGTEEETGPKEPQR
jgi:hypothetical protein